MTSKVQKINCVKFLNLILKIIEWILFLGLCGVSAMLTKDVLEKFMDDKSSFSVEMQQINVQPTLTICFDSCIHMLEYGIDFKLMYERDGNTAIEMKENDNTFLDGENIKLVRLANAYKISSSNYTFRKGETRRVGITFFNDMQTIEISRLPYVSMKIFVTSEPNAYGVSMGKWMDGEFLEFDLTLSYASQVSLISERFQYLKQKSNCSEESFYEVWGKAYIDLIKEKCNTTCATISLPLRNASLCDYTNWSCAEGLRLLSFTKFLKSENYFGPCTKLQYKGNLESSYLLANNLTSIFSYKFGSPEMTTVHEEYFIYDTTGMIGSVGGSLGMCIGFSFSNIFNWLIYKIRNNINK